MPQQSALLDLVRMLVLRGVAPSEAFAYSRDFLDEIKGIPKPDMAKLIRIMGKDVINPQARQSPPKKGKSIEIEIGTKENHYIIPTTLPANFVRPLLAETLIRWVKFAEGQSSLGGKRLKHPSGRYASTISMDQSGSRYTIYSTSPYAQAIETGRPAFNLHWGKTTVVPIGKNSLVASPSSPLVGTILSKMEGNSRAKITPNIKVRAKALAAGESNRSQRYGNQVFRTGTPDKDWHIGPMRVYSPAYHLWQKLKKQISNAERGI